MKFGLLINRNCTNLGDDIQSYAESLFLPRIDYLVDREHISDFRPNAENEVVATIMGAWWMRHKWNFPPPKNIYPLWVSMHLMDYSPEQTGSPIYDELFRGIGGEYMRAYGPVGTRDMATLKVMEDLNIPAYFSGCVTLTLPKQKKKKLEKEYILLVDLDSKVENKIKKELSEKNIEIRKTSNKRHQKRTPAQMDDWSFRRKEAVELLELYQNAKCVITRRLHVSLPCLAMEVPVLCIYDPDNIRFDPYSEWLHMVSPEDYLAGKYDYDFMNPKPNKTKHLEARNNLIGEMEKFVKKVTNDSRPLSEAVETTYTNEAVYEWQYDLMKETLNKWLPVSIKMSKKIKKLKNENKNLRRKLTEGGAKRRSRRKTAVKKLLGL